MRELAHLEGGGELGERMRALDWARTPLGPPENWPRSLKTAVRIMLTSRQPFWIGWGPELTYLYNDPYKSIIGGKHPAALGRPFQEVWHEIWDVVGPMARVVLEHDEGTYVEAQLLLMERHGYPEETYYTFSYSPIPDDDGRPGGLICANTDDTRRVIGERQLASLRELAARTASAKSGTEAIRVGVDALAANAHDVPFSMVFSAARTTSPMSLLAASEGTISLADPASWPLDAQDEREGVEVVGLAGAAHVPKGVWPRPPTHAAIVPVSVAGAARCVLVAGLNPFRKFDDSYRGYLELAGKQLASAVANADAYEQERHRAEVLAELDQAKTVFFNNVSHEFRTPLTLMLGPLEDVLSHGEELPPGVWAQVDAAHRNGLRLLKLVNALLDFSRIEAGRMQARYQPTDLATFTAELASLFRSAIERAGIRLEVDCAPLDPPIYVDRGMWEKIVFNLLSNAFKYTYAGAIRVSVRQEDDLAVLSVEDTGTGIPQEELPRLFTRFHRVKGARGRTVEGTGIGLSLVLELAKLHGGTVDVRSELGEGSVFSVAIPVGTEHIPADRIGAVDAPSAHVTSAAYVDELRSWLGDTHPDDAEMPDRMPEANAARILLADDNRDMRDYVRRLLGGQYVVEAVEDGVAALAAARRNRPDLILTDVMMPRLDGFGLLRALRADEMLAPVPVIMLSARAGEEARVEGIEAGADDYLVKPFSARELLALVTARLAMSRLQEERRRLVAELRESDRRKDEFLAMLGHELRNPLAAISTATQLWRFPKRDERALERAGRVLERQTSRMTRLIDGLLEISRVARGKLSLQFDTIDLREIVDAVVEDRGENVGKRGVTLSSTAPPHPTWVRADRIRLVQVVDNLLDNAMKFTDEGGTITFVIEDVDGRVSLHVRDTGVGIRPALLSQIFEPFQQDPADAARSRGGLGLGLALCKGIVELHDGTVTAESQGVGTGATFTVTLPSTNAPTTPSVDAPAVVTEPSPGSRRLLIVEDNEDAAQMLADLLRMQGHVVHTVGDAVAALQLLHARPIDLVLCDLGLPGMSGLEMAQAVRTDPAIRQVPLVAVTGYGQPDDRKRSAEAGFDEHLTKPIAFDQIADVVRRLARGQPRTRGVRRRAPD